jgi:hypothetical protein
MFTFQQAKAVGNYTYGDAVVFKSGKVFMNFALYDDHRENSVPKYLFTVVLKSSKKHLSYPRDCKLVVKFANDSILELRSFGDVIREMETTNGVEYADGGIEYTGRINNPYYEIPWISHSMPYISIYYTGRDYLLEDTDLQKLLMWPIVKVEVELANGVKKNFKVSKRRGKKVLKELQNCWRSLK